MTDLGLFVPFKLPYQVVDGLVGPPLAVGVITRMDEVVVVEHEFHQCAFLCAREWEVAHGNDVKADDEL